MRKHAEPEESAEVEAKPTAQTARTPAPAPVAQPSTRLSAFDKAELCKSLAIGNIPEGFVDKVTRKARAMGSVKTIDDPAPPHLEAFAKLRQDGCDLTCSSHSELRDNASNTEVTELGDTANSTEVTELGIMPGLGESTRTA